MRRRSPPTVPRRVTRALAAGCLVAATTACGSTSDSEWRAQLCPYFESDDYPVLESTATRTLDGLDHSVERLSTCEEWGRPGAVLVVQLRDRPSRESVLHLLAERGWRRTDAVGADVFGSGGTVASVSADDGGAVVQISFSRDA